MRATVQVNRSQFDAMPVVVLPVDRVGPAVLDLIPVGTGVHVFTDAELRARDERIVRATYYWDHCPDEPMPFADYEVARIIAAAEGDELAYHRRMTMDEAASPAVSARLAEIRAEADQ